MNQDLYQSFQIAREYGLTLNDEFFQWCFSERLYTPLQVLTDSALILFAQTGFVVIVGYDAPLFRKS